MSATGTTAPLSVETGVDTANDAARLEARQRFESGMKLYEEGDFSLALLEFERAYSRVPEHRVLFNIGQVNIQLGRYARAMRTLRQYLAEGGERIAPERRASVLADLEMLAARTASIQLSVNVANAEVVLDNDVIATTPMQAPVLVDAGEHRLTVRKPGYLTQTRPVAMVGRDQLRIDWTLEPEPHLIPTGKTIVVEHHPERTADPAAARRTRLLTVGWIGTGLLGSAWATAGYLGYTTNLERESKLATATTPAELNDLKSSTRHWYIAADVFGTLTLGATATMLYYTLTSTKSASPGKNAGRLFDSSGISFGSNRVVVSTVF